MSNLLVHTDPLPGYAYTAVQNGHIRIMEVLPGRGDDPIVCLMQEVSLDEQPQYEALSYVWGDPPALVSCVYIVHAHTTGLPSNSLLGANEDHANPQERPYFLPVTATLHCALTRLRHPEQSRRLWADAICINQKDLGEQSTQVGMMTRIFGQAERVVAHLGPEEDGSEILPSILKKIRDHEAYRRENGKGDSMNHFWDELDMSFTSPEVWKPVWSFLERPWFRRGWIIQEVLLARDVEIYCGDWELEWDLFKSPAALAAEYARTSGDNYGWQFLAAKGTPKLPLQLIRSRERADPLNLLQLLDSFRFFPVTKRQDKIYSLLGICADRDDPAFTINYSEPPEDTFTRYAKRFVEKGHGVKLLYCAANSSHGFTGPSWVPNWDDTEFPRTRLASVAESSFYSASETSTPTMNVIPDSSNLRISGIIVDKLEQLSDFSPSDDRRKCRNDICAAWQALQSLLKEETPYHGQSVHEVLWRTMICDSLGEFLSHLGSEFARMLLAWDHKKMSEETYSWFRVYGDPERVKTYFPASERIKRMHEERFMQTPIQYAGVALDMLHWKRFAVSSTGYLASVPVSSLPGDIVCVVMGASVPFILRPVHGGYQLIGECFVHGLMCGEALKMPGLEVEALTLV